MRTPAFLRTLFFRRGVTLLLLGMFLILGTINLEATPPVWWDEGWTLNVARNWVEKGHYGSLLDGAPAPPGLAASWPIVAPIALSFQMFGVGIWQGRLPGLVLTICVLCLTYWLTRELYDRTVASATVAILLCMSSYPVLHPVLIGRQVLGEIPLLCYTLAGYACFLRALRGTWWLGGAAALLWAIALRTKAQLFPFWMISLVVPFSLALFSRHWRPSMLGLSILGTLGLYYMLGWFPFLLLGQEQGVAVSGLYSVTAFVTIPWVRWKALSLALTLGFPTLLGLCYATSTYLRWRDNASGATAEEIVRLALLLLAGSWFVWYATLSNGVPRYLFPPAFLGSMFLAALISDLTSGFRLSHVVRRLTEAVTQQNITFRDVGSVLAMAFIGISMVKTGGMLYRTFTLSPDTSVVQVAEFLNTYTPADALVETYDSPLFFLLERRYHYPPDRVSVELVRTMFLQQAPHVDYDPLEQDPDYLVVKQPFMMWWTLYEPAIQAGEFRLIQRYGRYKIYERVRSEQTDTGAEEHLLTPTDSRHHSVRLGLAGTRALPDRELEKSRQAVIY